MLNLLKKWQSLLRMTSRFQMDTEIQFPFTDGKFFQFCFGNNYDGNSSYFCDFAGFASLEI